MSEETTQTQATPEAASNTAGENRGRNSFKKDDAAIGALAGEPKFRSRRRKRVSYLTINKINTVDYKDVNLLRRFINDRGKILSSKVTGNTAKQQRMVAHAIRRAREMALLPFVVTEMGFEQRPGGRGRSRHQDYDGGPRQPRENNEERTPKAETQEQA
ncbi:MAG: 30S ribosomal protein S18 [Armatimonadetes bacterium]|nr:30S ribosomal protein S18 [Armatimonadota bacterium]